METLTGQLLGTVTNMGKMQPNQTLISAPDFLSHHTTILFGRECYLIALYHMFSLSRHIWAILNILL